MKKIAFLLLTVLLVSFNYAYSEKNSSKETIIKDCKNECINLNDDLDFCRRICEKEIFNPRWKFLGFVGNGTVLFYDPESLSSFQDIIEVWTKIIYSEGDKQKIVKFFEKVAKEVIQKLEDKELEKELELEIKKLEENIKNTDTSLALFRFNCSKKTSLLLEVVNYDTDGVIMGRLTLKDKKGLLLKTSIIPGTVGETLLKEVCELKNKK
jgi:GTPase SAR1 family protein